MTIRPTVSSLTAVAILAAAVLVPATWLDSLAPCPFKAFTGVACPGCGLTHAFIAVGDIRCADAWSANPAVFAVLPLIAWFAVEPWWRERLTPQACSRILRHAAWITASACAGVWCWRLSQFAPS